MRINFDQNIKNLEGIPMTLETDGKKEPITLKYCAVGALLASYPDENPTPGEKSLRYALARKIHKGETEITKFELEKLKTVIGKQFNTLVVGAAFDLLDATEEKVEPRPKKK